MPELSIITCTGVRQEAFSLLEKWVARQTFKKPYEWIVVDDGPNPTQISMGQTYVRGPTVWYDGFNTQRGNCDAGMKAATGDKLIFLEDDEYIAPDFLKVYCELLDHAPVVGEGCAKYYNIGMPAHMELHNQGSASLTQTGFRRELIPIMDRAINSGEFFFDIKFWKLIFEKKIDSILFFEKNLLYGMKGLPGRHGLGGGHDRHKGYIHDGGYGTLKKWLGAADAQVYIDMQAKIKQLNPNAHTKKQAEALRQNNRVVPQPGRQQAQMQVQSRARGKITSI